MNSILFVSSSPRSWDSYSHRVARRIVDDLVAGDSGARVVARDLAKQPLPQIGAAFATGRAVPLQKQDAADRQALALSDALVDELLTDVEVVRVEGVALGEKALSQALRSAEARADAIVHKIASHWRTADVPTSIVA